MDLLKMSKDSLVRRKLRTILTVMGVVIGTASIVVMLSLGLGLQQSVYQMAEESGGLTSITVTVNEQAQNASGQNKKKLITDDAIREIQSMQHIKSADPVLTVPAKLTKGKYEANIQLTGMKSDSLKTQNLPMGWGTLPSEQGGLSILPGNLILANFHVKGSGDSMGDGQDSDTEELPDIDFKSDYVFLSFTGTEGNENASANTSGTAASGSSPGAVQNTQSTKKYAVKASGVLKGDVGEWNMYSQNVYVDMDKLLKTLKKQSKGGVIPGQPTKKSGKPYPYLVYSSAVLQADSSENVKGLMDELKAKGYQTSSNMELIESSKKQFAMIQAVLGAIGAVSLLVAAIGIANTMMMSIYERTKEIGVIKVLGCDMKNIKQMFLTEAAFIGFFGGLAGNVLSLLISFVINRLVAGGGASLGVSGDISVIPIWLVLMSMGFSVFIGMVAGYFPASRAMKLSPLVAISG